MTPDEDAIVRCALDYFEGWFEADPERMRARAPSRPGQAVARRRGRSTRSTAQWMIEATEAGSGKEREPGARRIDVRVVEVHGDIATAVVDSNVYCEYLHLVRTEAGWKIVNALWELAWSERER